MHRKPLCEQIPSLAIAEQSTASHLSSYKLKSTLLQGPLSCPSGDDSSRLVKLPRNLKLRDAIACAEFTSWGKSLYPNIFLCILSSGICHQSLPDRCSDKSQPDMHEVVFCLSAATRLRVLGRILNSRLL